MMGSNVPDILSRSGAGIPVSATASQFTHVLPDNSPTSINSLAPISAGGYAQIVIKPPHTAEPKKAKRKRITPEQLKELTAVFEKTDTPTHDIREELSKKLSMTNREVQVWFQNRRAKYNRMKAEHQRQMRTNAALLGGIGIVHPAGCHQIPLPPPMTHHHYHSTITPTGPPTHLPAYNYRPQNFSIPHPHPQSQPHQQQCQYPNTVGPTSLHNYQNPLPYQPQQIIQHIDSGRIRSHSDTIVYPLSSKTPLDAVVTGRHAMQHNHQNHAQTSTDTPVHPVSQPQQNSYFQVQPQQVPSPPELTPPHLQQAFLSSSLAPPPLTQNIIHDVSAPMSAPPHIQFQNPPEQPLPNTCTITDRYYPKTDTQQQSFPSNSGYGYYQDDGVPAPVVANTTSMPSVPIFRAEDCETDPVPPNYMRYSKNGHHHPVLSITDGPSVQPHAFIQYKPQKNHYTTHSISRNSDNNCAQVGASPGIPTARRNTYSGPLAIKVADNGNRPLNSHTRSITSTTALHPTPEAPYFVAEPSSQNIASPLEHEREGLAVPSSDDTSTDTDNVLHPVSTVPFPRVKQSPRMEVEPHINHKNGGGLNNGRGNKRNNDSDANTIPDSNSRTEPRKRKGNTLTLPPIKRLLEETYRISKTADRTRCVTDQNGDQHQRARAYTSPVHNEDMTYRVKPRLPPIRHVEDAQSTIFEHEEGRQPQSALPAYQHVTNAIDDVHHNMAGKLGIDVLASAAVSMSSPNPHIQLPHFAPLPYINQGVAATSAASLQSAQSPHEQRNTATAGHNKEPQSHFSGVADREGGSINNPPSLSINHNQLQKMSPMAGSVKNVDNATENRVTWRPW